MRTRIRISATSFFFLVVWLLFSCSENTLNDSEMNQKLAGCWVGGLIRNDSLTEDVELRLIRLKPDSTLVLNLIYELGPRSRVWEYDVEISCRNHEISWLAHEGHLSENLDTMYLNKNWKGEKSQWMFYRDKKYDHFIDQFLSNTKRDYTYSIPERNTDSLYCASLEDVGIDSYQITEFIKKIITGSYGDIHSMLIYREGKLVLEEYFALNGEITGTFINETYREKTHQLSSVTKGILSMVTGIAIDKGYISDINEPVFSHLPQYASYFTEDEKQIQIKHLLTMTSGWDWDQFNYSWNDVRNDAANMYKCKDVVEYILDRPLKSKPGEKFNYTNGEPTILGVVLRNVCEMEVDKYTELHLFNPLGITEHKWTRYPDGSLETDGGLKLCSRDLLKIGILMLNNGVWQGERLISEKWISESIKSRINLSMQRGYGYYWNNMQYGFGGKSENAIFVPGDGGQFLAVFPSLDMVVVFTAGIYDKDPAKMYWAIINNSILPAMEGK
jgi:CubicO group peptidase (beta-lactamase class C family)